MRQVNERQKSAGPALERRSELGRPVVFRKTRRYIYIQLAARREERTGAVEKKQGRFRRLAGKAAGFLLHAFWFFFLGGFLNAAARFLLGESTDDKEVFFNALDNHKYLWYTSAIWKRNP